MKPHSQAEFDFGDPRQARISHALRSASGSMRRAVPLSDTDKLMLACMDSLARQIASEADHMTDTMASQHTAREVKAFVGSLGDVSQEFAIETRRHLEALVRQYRSRRAV